MKIKHRRHQEPPKEAKRKSTPPKGEGKKNVRKAANPDEVEGKGNKIGELIRAE